jgi:phosphatidylinositol transfer protein SFH5
LCDPPLSIAAIAVFLLENMSEPTETVPAATNPSGDTTRAAPVEQVPEATKAEVLEPSEPVAPVASDAKSEAVDSKPPAPSTEPASGPVWPDLKGDHPLSRLLAKLPELLSKSEYDEVYGVHLKTKMDSGKPDFHTLLILQKFLRANANDLDKAEEQLLKTLQWRKEFDPAKLLSDTFRKEKFGGLGYVTVLNDGAEKEVVTWNIYGAVKDYEKTFVPVDE